MLGGGVSGVLLMDERGSWLRGREGGNTVEHVGSWRFAPDVGAWGGGDGKCVCGGHDEVVMAFCDRCTGLQTRGSRGDGSGMLIRSTVCLYTSNVPQWVAPCSIIYVATTACP